MNVKKCIEKQNQNSNVVISYAEKIKYNNSVYFRPDTFYPEYPFEKETDISSEKNYVYEAVRNGLRLYGLDGDNYGTLLWNPLAEFIRPGDVVLVKPNLVWHSNKSGNGVECLYTQPSVAAAVLDYVCIALKGKGKIIVADAPMQSCDFTKLISESGYDRLIDFYKNKGIDINLKDLRAIKTVIKNGMFYYTENETLDSKIIDLKNESEFAGLSDEACGKLRITDYDPNYLQEHHNRDRHEYSIASDILNADVVINLPKPKTHRKAGLTISLKNMIGISARKEYLPHHTNGSVKDGGDSYLSPSLTKKIRDKLLDKKNYNMQTSKMYFAANIQRYMVKVFYELSKFGSKDKFYDGSWYGNDTISRTIADINKIVFFADKNGKLTETQQRKYLIIADMIVSGEKEGPLSPSPKEVGAIAIGTNPVYFDMIIGKMMGIKLDRYNTIKRVLNPNGKYRFAKDGIQPTIISNDININGKRLCDINKNDIWNFIPTSGWYEAFKGRRT